MKLIPLQNIPLVKEGDSVSRIIIDSIKENKLIPQEGDVFIITHNIISLSERSLYSKDNIEISDNARRISELTEQDPRKIEAALNEAELVIRDAPILITKTRHGLYTDYSGIDESNAPLGYLLALPKNSHLSAAEISKSLSDEFKIHLPVIISDTQGRPWRKGAVNIAIGYSGLSPFIENAGKSDLYGRRLQSSKVCLVDELAAAAELLMGQADEGIPIVVIRNVSYSVENDLFEPINRSEEENLFL